MRYFISILILVVITGCASTNISKRVKSSDSTPQSIRPTYNLAGYPAAFKDGYIDGCETAKKSKYSSKDELRFTEDNQYRNGWKDGYNICLGK